MKILLVAATSQEIEPLLSILKKSVGSIKSHQVDTLITGVGMVATAFNLGKHLALNTYHIALNIGIAGSFNSDIAIGEVVLVSRDIFSELGAEDGDQFISIDNLGFGTAGQVSEIDIPIISSKLSQLKKVRAITVNKVHGSEESIQKTRSQFNADIESMEGAAFFYACNQFYLPCLQVRAISNFVERRNTGGWNIGLAIKNLNNFTLELIESIKT